MVHWKPLGTALQHDALGLAMSGSCVDDGANTSGLVPGGGMVAVYTSTTGGEAQSLAYSTDRGGSWRRYDGNPVIPNDGRKDFRDPKVFWHEPTKSWVMVVSVNDHVSIFAPPTSGSGVTPATSARALGRMPRSGSAPTCSPSPMPPTERPAGC